MKLGVSARELGARPGAGVDGAGFGVCGDGGWGGVAGVFEGAVVVRFRVRWIALPMRV